MNELSGKRAAKHDEKCKVKVKDREREGGGGWLKPTKTIRCCERWKDSMHKNFMKQILHQNLACNSDRQIGLWYKIFTIYTFYAPKSQILLLYDGMYCVLCTMYYVPMHNQNEYADNILQWTHVILVCYENYVEVKGFQTSQQNRVK